MECHKLPFADLSNQTFVHDTYMDTIDMVLCKYYKYPYQVSPHVLRVIRYLCECEVDAENIIDFLYEHGVEFMCEDLGLGIPCYRAEAATIGSEDVSEEHVVGSTVQTAGFMDGPPITILDLSASGIDSTRVQEDLDTSSLASFLERPRIIHAFEWHIGTDLNIDIHPWQEYLQGFQATVNKIHNFNLFRAKALRLEIRTNGSPFHYGRFKASYMPGPRIPVVAVGMENPHNMALVVANYDATFNAITIPLFTFYSQIPHVDVDPATNIPQRMDLPFFNNLNYVNLLFTEQLTQMGTLKLWCCNQLQHANGATDPVSVVIYASIVDPVLSMPTARDAFTGQAMRRGAPSRKGKRDEYSQGIISKPASSIAKFAGKLSEVPLIGPYAKATEIGASAISSMASLFGFSKPCNITDPVNVYLRTTSEMTTTLGLDGASKLSLDPKAEITVDPTTVGLSNEDAMSFAHIGKRESMICQIPWESSDLTGTNLVHITVHPSVCPRASASGPATFFPTAVHWLSQPFDYWRGSLEYRIQIVASQMHRGRIAITYNPSDHPTQSTLSPDFVTQYTQFVDLADHRDITYTVRWGSADPFRLVELEGDAVNLISRGASVTSDYTKCISNGTLSIYVVNQLAAPETTSGVTLNVYIKAGDDFMLASPNNRIENHCYYNAPIDTAYAEAAVVEFEGEAMNIDFSTFGETKPSLEASVIINGTEADTPDIDDVSKVFFGEQICSVRSLLKRYNLLRTIVDNGTAVSNLVQLEISHPMFPPGPGLVYFDSTAIGTTTTGPFDWNYLHMTYLHYFRQGYAAYRGSVRYKYLGNIGTQNAIPLIATRHTASVATANRFAITIASNINSGSVSARAAAMLGEDREHLQSQSGLMLRNILVNNGIEFEQPWYAPVRFLWTAQIYEDAMFAANPKFSEGVALSKNHHKVLMRGASTALGTAWQFSQYVAAGEDFSLHYFVAAPVYGFTGSVTPT